MSTFQYRAAALQECPREECEAAAEAMVEWFRIQPVLNDAIVAVASPPHRDMQVLSVVARVTSNPSRLAMLMAFNAADEHFREALRESGCRDTIEQSQLESFSSW